jgi:hypothetical protein
MTKGSRRHDVQKGLPAATLYEAINTAQAIVQPIQSNDMSEDEQEEFFSQTDVSNADLDAALADPPTYRSTPADSVLDEDQVAQDGPEPVVKVSQAFINDISEQQPGLYTQSVNRKNAKIDGYPCPNCGNLNKVQYTVTCPQCPKESAPEKPDTVKQDFEMVKRLKSLQGRVLTIMDASFGDKVQRESVKTLINKEFRREINRIGNSDEE